MYNGYGQVVWPGTLVTSMRYPFLSKASLIGPSALFLLALSGCDNPACVFSETGCDNGGPDPNQLGPGQAVPPIDGQRILGANPTLLEAQPSGDGVFPTSPLVLRFTESMSSDSLEGAFELGDRFSGTTYPLNEPPVLVGDGRVVILQPRVPLPDGRDYELRLADNAQVTDITGQDWNQVANNVLLTFGTNEAQNPTPRVYMTVPPNTEAGVSDIGEVSVVFDRLMDPLSINSTSMELLIGGAAPVGSPQPASGFSGGTPITSVWTWFLEDDFGSRISLGPGSAGKLTLSPVGDRIADVAGTELPTSVTEFTLADFTAPVGGIKPFGAQDAIGLTDLLNPAAPVLQVELAEPAIIGEELYVYLFGRSAAEGDSVAFERRIAVVEGTQLVDLFSADLGLLDEANMPLLRDGELRVACVSQRGTLRSGLRVLDGSPLVDGVQDFGLDFLPPGIFSMGFSGEPTTFLRSEQRDIVPYGLASEALTGALVTSALGTNVTLLNPPAPVQVGAFNYFMTAPVPTGIVDPNLGPVDFTLSVFDQALNTDPMPFQGQYEQVGIANTGSVLAGGLIEVWVHDAETLAPLGGARVMTHVDDAGLAFVGFDFTDQVGKTSVASAALGGTSLTVDLPGYDLFTFHGVGRNKVQVLLDPILPPTAQWAGQVQATFPNAPLTNVSVLVSDTRLNLDGHLWRATSPCSLDTGASLYRCNFLPEIGRTGRMGFGTFIAGDLTLPQQAFSPLSFLRAFGWETGQPLLATDGLGNLSILFVDTLLTTGVIEDLPIELMPQVLSTASAVSLGNLVDPPRVMVDGISPAMGRPVLVGLGLAYGAGANAWDIRTCIPGVVDGVQDNASDALGVLVEFGSLEPDHYLRVEVVDEDDNLTVVRKPISELNGGLIVTDVAVLTSPAPGGNSGGNAYDVRCTDPLRDGLGMGGMYRVRLTSAGRSWNLWRADPPDGGDISVPLPAIAAQGGQPLVNGAVTGRISYWAVPGLDESEFMWADLSRRAQFYSRSKPFTFTQN